MKKFLYSLVLCSILMFPTFSFADNFTKREALSNGKSDLCQVFKVNKGEYVRLRVTNKARGGVLFFIEDEEGNVVIDNALTVASGFEKAVQKDVEFDLPKGKYVLKAQGQTLVNTNPFTYKRYTENSNGYFKVNLKTIKYKK